MNTEMSLTGVIARNWWTLLLRGLIALAFGIFIFFQPDISLTVLILVFGIFIFADGILGVWTALAGRKSDEDWWVWLLWGLVGIGIGILAFLAPDITALALLFYIAIWAIATGVLQLVAAIRLRKEITGEWLLIIGGIASVLLGILLIAQPGVGILALLWLLAAYAVLFGLVMIFLAFKARAFGRQSVSL